MATKLRTVDGIDQKLCSCCGVWKPLTDFSPGESEDGRHCECRKCNNARHRRRYAEAQTRDRVALALFARPTASVSLACGCHLAIVIDPQHARRRGTSLATQHGSGAHPLLCDKIISQGKRGLKILPAMRGTILRKIGNRFEGELSVGDQVTKGNQRPAVGWHTPTVRQARCQSKR
jgi:hypothetical protein